MEVTLTRTPLLHRSPSNQRRRAPSPATAKMKAVVAVGSGDLRILEVESPPLISSGDVLIRVAATALNRGEVPSVGPYSPPEGSSRYPGLECSGVVVGVGESVDRWKIGDQVCALLKGGGYAEEVIVPAKQVLPIPRGISLIDAASFPEVACTVWSTVFMMSHLSPGETFLIHGGSSGIGTFAIQIAKYYGIRIFVTAGTEEKLSACKHLGADICINYKTEDFVERIKEETGGNGVDVILDYIGGSYLQRNVDSLNIGGRLFCIGCMEGANVEVNLSSILSKHLTIQAARLRHRSAESKAAIVQEVEKHVWPAIVGGKVKPVIYKSFPLSEASEAHKLMESCANIGKILLTNPSQS